MSLSPSQHSDFVEQLTDQARQIGVDVSDEQAVLCIDYLSLLVKWNKAYNLTSVRDPREMLSRHLIDSLSISRFVTAPRVMDVGTGPGLPGIPLSILHPDKSFTLVDSNIKKTRFITQSTIELGIKNVTVEHARIETLAFDQPFGQITSRAFTALDNMVELCHMHLAENGEFLAMKGLDPHDEKQAMNSLFHVKQIERLDIPGCDAQRHLIIIGRNEEAIASVDH